MRLKKNNNMQKFSNNCNLLLMLVFLLISNGLLAQNLDSLENVTKTGTPEEKMGAFLNLSNYYFHSNNQKSINYAFEIVKLAQNEKNKKWEANAYYTISANYANQYISDSALYYAQKALKLYEEINNEKLVIITKSSIAVIYANSKKIDEALQIHFECLEYFKREGLEEREGHTLFSIGALYGDLKLSDLSNEYTLKALKIFEKLEEKMTSNYILGACYINICANFFDKEDYNEAIVYAEKSLDFFRNTNNIYLYGKALQHKIDCLQELNRIEEAFKYIEELDDISEQLENKYFSREVLIIKGKLFMKKRQYKKALECFEKSLALTDSTIMRNSYIIPQLLAEASAFAGTPYETYEYIQKFAKSFKESFNEEWSEKLTEMEVKYETEKKQREIDRQQQIIARQNMYRLLLVAGVAVFALLVVLLWLLLHIRNRSNRTLKELNLTKDKFFSIISHDIKNPAIAQRDAIKTLLDSNVNQWNEDKLANYYKELLKSAEGEVELIFNLLGWAQIQTGRIDCKPQTVVINDLLPDINLISKMAEKKGVNFKLSIPDSAIITGDCNIISTVLRNLLTNAIKFTPAGGDVTLEITNNDNIAGYTFSVIDTGTGINKEQMKDLFSLFKPHSTAGTDGEQGGGLGLIVCKEMLEIHGSVLHVESEVGKGSRFWFLVRCELI